MTVRMVSWGHVWWRTVTVWKRTVAAWRRTGTVLRRTVSGRDGGASACCACCACCPERTGRCAPAGWGGMVSAVVRGGVRDADCGKVGAWVAVRVSCSSAVELVLV